jgi:cellulose synthase/poly-beta-1,6-N-acetylglucosamine synthase-like glycosyltransferase
MADVSQWIWVLAWAPSALVAGQFVGYCALLLSRPAREAPGRPFTPPLTVLLPAHDEEAHIAAKLDELLACDYPPDRLRVIVIDDGSQDATAARVEHLADPRVRLVRQPERRGKVPALLAGLAHCDTDVIVGTDATARTEPDSIRRLVGWLAEEGVGGVSARVEVANRTASLLARCQSFILQLQNAIKRGESALDSAAGLSGPLYAWRRSALGEIDPDTVLEDRIFAIQLRERGHAVRYAHDAVVHYHSATVRRDFTRQKTRIMAGAFESLSRFGGMLFRPRYGLYGLLILPEYVLFRSARPFLVALSAVALVLGAAFGGGPGMALQQGAAIALMLVGALALACLLVLPRVPDRAAFLRDALVAPPGLVLLTLGTLLGALAFWRGRHAATWHRVDRSPPASRRESP